MFVSFVTFHSKLYFDLVYALSASVVLSGGNAEEYGSVPSSHQEDHCMLFTVLANSVIIQDV